MEGLKKVAMKEGNVWIVLLCICAVITAIGTVTDIIQTKRLRYEVTGLRIKLEQLEEESSRTVIRESDQVFWNKK